MPILILLGIAGICGVICFKESTEKTAPPISHNQREQITSEMIGKSKKECRKILKKYIGGWLHR